MDDSGRARECQMDGGSEAHSELSQRERETPFLFTWRCRDSGPSALIFSHPH